MAVSPSRGSVPDCGMRMRRIPVSGFCQAKENMWIFSVLSSRNALRFMPPIPAERLERGATLFHLGNRFKMRHDFSSIKAGPFRLMEVSRTLASPLCQGRYRLSQA